MQATGLSACPPRCGVALIAGARFPSLINCSLSLSLSFSLSLSQGLSACRPSPAIDMLTRQTKSPAARDDRLIALARVSSSAALQVLLHSLQWIGLQLQQLKPWYNGSGRRRCIMPSLRRLLLALSRRLRLPDSLASVLRGDVLSRLAPSPLVRHHPLECRLHVVRRSQLC